MNQGPSDMYYSTHMSTGQAPAPQTVTSSGLGHYSNHQQPPPLQPGPSQYSQAPAHYGQYGGYSNGLTSAHGGQVPGSIGSQGNVLSLPSLTAAQPVMHSPYPPQPQGFDTTGQVAPQGMKPRVTATLWEDEGALCFQVEAKGICVARREDNHMINGTKLLNVAGMTRGRRDGILKSEKMRHVVKIGPMHLKGVWIPFDRALDFANKEKITELLYPLFVHNIGALLYHPTNQPRNHVAMQAAERRKQEQSQMRAGPGLPNPVQPHHHHSMHGSIGGGSSTPQHSGPSHSGLGRPEMPRSHTFPTPPTSATGVMGSMGQSDGSFWGGQGISNVHGSNGLAIDTALSNARSMPTTPATTPPGASIHGVQQQYQSSQSYDPSRQVYSTPSLHQSSYQQSNGAPSSIGGRYSQPNSYIKSEMGPPSGRTLGSGGENDHLDNKAANGLVQHSQSHDQASHHANANDEEADHENDTEYAHDGNAYDTSRGPYNYAPGPPVGAVGADQGQISPELNGSPGNQAGSGRATPRTAATTQGYYSQHQGGYDTPPRAQPPSSNLYNVMSSERGTANGSSGNDMYHSQPELVNQLSNGYTSTQSIVNGTPGGKRGRDDDDDDQRPPSREPGQEIEGLKRRRTIHEDSAPNLNYDPSLNRQRAATMQRRR